MIYGDNQTRHLYVVTDSSDVVKTTLSGYDKFRLKVYEGGEAAVTATSDIISTSSVKSISVNTPESYKPKEWDIHITDGATADTVVTNAEYYKLYFSAENVLNMGQLSRVDRVIKVLAKNATTTDLFYKNLAKELYNQILGDATSRGKKDIGALNNEIEIGIKTSGGFVNVKDTASFEAATALCTTVRHIAMDKSDATKIEAVKNDIRTDNYPPYTVDLNISGDCCYYVPDPDDPTNPKKYTYVNGRLWIADKTDTDTAVQYAEGSVISGTYTNGDRIYDMENYFLRNREDLKDINNDFDVAAINKQYADITKNYVCVDAHFTYGAYDKEITIATEETSTSDFTVFDVATANDSDALIKVNTAGIGEDPVYEYYYLPEGHTAGTTLANTTTIKIEETEGYAYQIANLFK